MAKNDARENVRRLMNVLDFTNLSIEKMKLKRETIRSRLLLLQADYVKRHWISESECFHLYVNVTPDTPVEALQQRLETALCQVKNLLDYVAELRERFMDHKKYCLPVNVCFADSTHKPCRCWWDARAYFKSKDADEDGSVEHDV